MWQLREISAVHRQNSLSSLIMYKGNDDKTALEVFYNLYVKFPLDAVKFQRVHNFRNKLVHKSLDVILKKITLRICFLQRLVTISDCGTAKVSIEILSLTMHPTFQRYFPALTSLKRPFSLRAKPQRETSGTDNCVLIFICFISCYATLALKLLKRTMGKYK